MFAIIASAAIIGLITHAVYLHAAVAAHRESLMRLTDMHMRRLYEEHRS